MKPPAEPHQEVESRQPPPTLLMHPKVSESGLRDPSHLCPYSGGWGRTELSSRACIIEAVMDCCIRMRDVGDTEQIQDLGDAMTIVLQLIWVEPCSSGAAGREF